MPFVHAVHVAAPAVLENEPGWHGVHLSIGSAVNFPTVHGVAAVAPAGQYEPASQPLHDALPSLAWNCPAAHSAHATFGSAEYLPALHSVSSELPSGQCLPGWHAFGFTVPATAQYDPAGHGASFDEPAAHHFPTAHFTFCVGDAQWYPTSHALAFVERAGQWVPAVVHLICELGVGQKWPEGNVCSGHVEGMITTGFRSGATMLSCANHNVREKS